MAQIKQFTWTNPNPAVVRDLDVGFTVAEITTIDITNGGSWQWTSNMVTGTALDVDAGTIVGASGGFTPLSESANYGAVISGFTNANPGVLTVDDTGPAGFANGDTVKVTAVADDGADPLLPLNDDYVIASFTATTITLVENTTSDNVYVSGGFVTRVTDTNGDAIPTENFARVGTTVGTTAVGANSATMVAIVKGENSVV